MTHQPATAELATATGGPTPRQRNIGSMGTTARVIMGAVMVGSVLAGHLPSNLKPGPWLLGLIGFPAAILAWQWSRARRGAPRPQATGPVATVLNIAVVVALYLTPWYAPALSISSDAALLFYGVSMLLAAARGYAGCEVLAISNWLLHRDDQIGCLVFSQIDQLERRLHRRMTADRRRTEVSP